MSSAPSEVSVVIPSVGRPSLLHALASVMRQEIRPAEILVVNDSGAPFPFELPAAVRVVETGKVNGAAAARNAGMLAARGEFVAFLDDDDEWLSWHLATALEVLDKRPTVDVFASRAVVKTEKSTRISPAVVIKPGVSLMDYFYGRAAWLQRERRIMTPTLVFRQHLTDIMFDTSLRAREDIWWLFQQEEHGRHLFQVEDVTVSVHGNEARERARSDTEAALNWATYLNSIRPGAGIYYLVGVLGRESARHQEWVEFSSLRRELRSELLPLDQRLVLAAETTLALFRELLRRYHRLGIFRDPT